MLESTLGAWACLSPDSFITVVGFLFSGSTERLKDRFVRNLAVRTLRTFATGTKMQMELEFEVSALLGNTFQRLPGSITKCLYFVEFTVPQVLI